MTEYQWMLKRAQGRALREEMPYVKTVDFQTKVLGIGCVLWCGKLGAVILNAVGFGNHMVVYVSYDRGMTWKEVFRDARDLGGTRGGYVTRNGVVLLSAGPALYRTEDLVKFERVFETTGLWLTRWIVEKRDGSLYTAEYFDVAPKIRFIRSVDGGKTWASTGGTIDDDHIHQMTHDKWRDRGLIVTGDTAHGVWETTDFVAITKLITLDRPTPIGVMPLSRGMLLMGENQNIFVAPNDASWVKSIFCLKRQWPLLSTDKAVASIAEATMYVTYGFFRVGSLIFIPGWDSCFLYFSREGREWNRIMLGDSVKWVDGDDTFVYAVGGKMFFRIHQNMFHHAPRLIPKYGEFHLLWFYELRDTTDHWTDNFSMVDWDRAVIFVVFRVQIWVTGGTGFIGREYNIYIVGER